MKFKPMSEKEIKDSGLWPDGEYKTIVLAATDTDNFGNPLITKSGAPKFDIDLELTNDEGKKRKIKCSLTPAYIKILKHFCEANGLMDKYESGEIEIDDIIRTGEFITVINKRSYKNSQNEDVTINNVVDFKSIKSNEVIDNKFNDVIPF